ncbi:MAG: protein kinase domain-containing protein, partial [Candidatus Hermodarchaeia archaeon]
HKYSNDGKRMPLSEILTLLEPIASALDFAHAKGAVHRDIKPANILISLHDDPVIVDFGIAKILDESIQLTGTGGVVGSPHYMSPEQASSAPITKTSDIYSFGVVLYQMAVGRVPFKGDSITGVLMQHLTDPPPPPRQLNHALSPAVEAIILKSLAKDPAERYASTGELIASLKLAQLESQVGDVSLDDETLIDPIQEVFSDLPPQNLDTHTKGTQLDVFEPAPSTDKQVPDHKPRQQKNVLTKPVKRIIIGVGLIIISVLVVWFIRSGGIIEAFRDLYYGDHGEVLLHTTLDNEDSITSPDIGIGGRFSLISSDFVPAQEDNGILFVRSGGDECQIDFQEVSFPTWKGDEMNVNMEDGVLTFWFKPLFNATDRTGEYNLFTITSEGGTPPFISLEFFDSQLRLIIEDEDGNWYETSAPSQAPLWKSGEWVHIRAVWDAYDVWDAYENEDSLRLFIDDVRVDPGGVLGGWRIEVFDTNIRINVGSSSPCGNYISNGIIDDLTIRHFP